MDVENHLKTFTMSGFIAVSIVVMLAMGSIGITSATSVRQYTVSVASTTDNPGHIASSDTLTITISTPHNGDTLPTDIVDVSGTVSDTDGSGIKDVSVKIDGGDYNPTGFISATGKWTFTTSPLSEGTHRITAKATDNADNIAETSIDINIYKTPIVPELNTAVLISAGLIGLFGLVRLKGRK